jgi:acyl-CoA synthetase (AMP-forming)/AMP-acid ligase II
VVACVSLKQAGTLAENKLKEYCRGKLPAFMLPDHFRFYEILPKNPAGKILKNQLREEARGALNPA